METQGLFIYLEHFQSVFISFHLYPSFPPLGIQSGLYDSPFLHFVFIKCEAG